jgi:hypothetical protein
MSGVAAFTAATPDGPPGPVHVSGSRTACPGTLRVMLLTAAPSLAYVIGLPAGLLLAVVAVGVGAWALIGRISRG